jgi:hypothetical protein
VDGAPAVSEIGQVHPYVLATLLCDYIVVEEGSSKKSLIGIFERIFAQAFPVVHRFGVYVKVVDAEGTYSLRVDYADISNDQVIERMDIGTFRAEDRLASTELVINLIAPIPAAGTYEFRIYANDLYLARATFTASLPN